MKIAVYGDSFGTSFPQNKHFAWFNLLAEKVNGKVFDEEGKEGYGIAQGGRATYLSYKNFLKHYKNYSLNIFIAGDPYRHTKEYKWNDKIFYISNANSIDWSVANGVIDEVEAELLRGWFLLSDHEFLTCAQDLILNDIKSKDPKCLIIPSQITNSFTSEFSVQHNMNFGLTQLHGVMLRSMNSPSDYWPRQEPPDRISCHYSVEVNHWLANAVYEYLTQNKKLELPEHIPHTHNYRYYFEEQ